MRRIVALYSKLRQRRFVSGHIVFRFCLVVLSQVGDLYLCVRLFLTVVDPAFFFSVLLR